MTIQMRRRKNDNRGRGLGAAALWVGQIKYFSSSR